MLLACHENEVRKAFRDAVREQIESFRSKVFSGEGDIFCKETGVRLFNDGDTHIDHEKRFHELLYDFIREIGLRSFHEVQVKTSQKADRTMTRIADEELAERWERYHAEHALLRPVQKTWNLRHNQLMRKAQMEEDVAEIATT